MCSMLIVYLCMEIGFSMHKHRHEIVFEISPVPLKQQLLKCIFYTIYMYHYVLYNL